MALPVRDQVVWWGVAAAVFAGALWGLGQVILPFVVGGAIAYFLDPVADRLERAGLSRVAATSTIIFGAGTVVVLAGLVLLPVVIGQAAALAEAMPQILARLAAFVQERVPDLADADGPLRRSLEGIGDTLRERSLALLDVAVSSAMGVVGFFVFILVVPVVAFYLLLDWDRMIGVIDAHLPRDHAPAIRQLAREIDAVLAGFVRGQLSVCLILAVFYAVALMAAGLQFGLVVGVVTGLISFIPYVGAIIGGVLSIGLALFQFWDTPLWILVILAIFAAGQFIEGNILVPRLVGGSVGLHPVWLLFSLSVFGALFGFVGMMVAVPVAAAIGVLARFGLRAYREGLLYRGKTGGPGKSFGVGE